MAQRAAFPNDIDDFDKDDRIAFDQVTQTQKLEAEDGTEWEFMPQHNKWRQVTDEAEFEKQQQIYKIEGVDEEEPAVDTRKRKATGADEDDNNGKAKKQKPEASRKQQVNKAIYVTNLPEDVDEAELHQVFSKYGVIAENAEGNVPRIKLYHDEEGKFKGDALIVYFRPESVQLAIDMLDETDFRLGQQVSTGKMSVTEADASFKSQKDQPLSNAQGKPKDKAGNRDRERVIKKNQEMNNRLADWDDDDPQSQPDTSSRWDKVVILKHMFTFAELAKNPANYLDIKEDIREECSKYGQVTNVTLYDLEADGIMTVRFTDVSGALACIKATHGRNYDCRKVEARQAKSKPKFKKSKKHAVDSDAEDEEARRLEGFGKHIEGD